ncbi:MAG: FAD-binding protein [Pseudomonadota bacterium]
MNTLVIAEHENGKLKPATLCAITAATQLGGTVDLIIAGHNIGSLTQECTGVNGVSKVIQADDASLTHLTAEVMTPVLTPICASYDAVIIAATAFGKNILPRLGAKLDVQPLADVIAIHGNNTYDRPVYAGNAIATVKLTTAKTLLSVRTTAFAPAATSGGKASVIKADIPAAPANSSRFVKMEASVSARPELTAAPVVVSGGRGLGSAENFKLLEKLADKLGAAIGASRAAVDAGYVPNDYQVGQTGKVVAPQLYIAVGISGAIQHLAGMKDSKVIVAINKDPDAPIFQIADYGLVGDLFTLLPELTEKI